MSHVVSKEQQAREEAVTARVVASFERCENPRLKLIMQSLVRHLHGFVRDIRPTEEEWGQAISFLTAVGDITNEKRQEFVLMSDTLGVSMQTITINNEAYGAATEATVFGPFFVQGSPKIERGGDISHGARGLPCWVYGTVKDAEGKPIGGARIEVWEADGDGMYDVQYPDGRMAARGHLFADLEGRYAFWAIKPVPYPIPHDGPVGKMLEATGRSPLRAPHFHFLITADGCRRLVTHIFVSGDPLLESDSVFGVKESLIKNFETQPAGTPTPNGRTIDGEWSKVRFDIVLAPTGP